MEGVSNTTTTGEEEAPDVGTVRAAADAIEGEVVGVAEAVGVLDRG